MKALYWLFLLYSLRGAKMLLVTFWSICVIISCAELHMHQKAPSTLGNSVNRPIRRLEIVVTNYRHKSFSGGLLPFSCAFRGQGCRFLFTEFPSAAPSFIPSSIHAYCVQYDKILNSNMHLFKLFLKARGQIGIQHYVIYDIKSRSLLYTTLFTLLTYTWRHRCYPSHPGKWTKVKATDLNDLSYFNDPGQWWPR